MKLQDEMTWEVAFHTVAQVFSADALVMTNSHRADSLEKGADRERWRGK